MHDAYLVQRTGMVLCGSFFSPVASCISSVCRGDTSGHELIPLSVHGLAKQREAGVLRLGAVQSFGDD